ncbi:MULTISPECIES: PIN-like domain-containing protein [Paraburkholderia]|uniref:PIN-like domain-containing protein n=1 Tax=Paraburkholderia TaxID=1822464 RepID=UPI00225649A3|nr:MULTISPECIES: PIN-like domain-containing protein [Paraburkholderia]MCX4176709.1 PIN-like domain-containing protein [Paraburkholderia madseniana]MDQ6464700.1 PIN-like domain-containing protein [Paraburkholderia madseniana]
MSSLFDLNEPIGLWELPLSPAGYETACYKALSDEETLVFLDTNVLSAAFRLHQEAREGLFKLLRIPLASKRLVVPAWVANEYVHNAFKASKNGHGFREADLERLRSSLPATKQLSAILHQVASDRDMEKIAKRLKVTPAEASRELNARVEQLAYALGDAGGDLAIDAVHRELLTELRAAFISNDLGQIARMLCEQAVYRRSSRIPPGLTDVAKGIAADGEEAAGNAEGDLAVWLEMLQLSAERASGRESATEQSKQSQVLFITQEKKEDFLYRPRRRLASAEKKVETEDNADIRLIDPRLASEFEFRVGHRRIAFANLESIAAGALTAIMEREFQDSVGMFISAMRKQKRVADTKVATVEGQLGEGSAEIAEEQAIDYEPELAMTAQEASEAGATLAGDHADREQDAGAHAADAEEGLLVSDEVMVERTRLGSMPQVAAYVQLIGNLLSENRKMEDLAIRRFQLVGVPPTTDTAFAVGRAMFAAMQRGAAKAAILFSGPRSLELQAPLPEQGFIAGGLFEAFFKSRGNLRETVLGEGLPMLLDRVTQPGWEPARDFIKGQLESYETRFFWIPGVEQHTLRVRVVYGVENDSAVIREVVATYPGKADTSLLRPRQSDLQSSYLGSTVNLATLRAALSRLSLLPDERVEIELTGPETNSATLTLPPDCFINTELVSVPFSE